MSLSSLDEWKEIINGADEYYIFGTGPVGRRLCRLYEIFAEKNSFRGFVVTKKGTDCLDDLYPIYNIDELSKKSKENHKTLLLSVSRVYHQDVYDAASEIFDTVIDAMKYFSLEIPKEDSECFKQRETVKGVDNDKRNAIIGEYFRNEHAFGDKEFYQSYPPLLISGDRPTDYRIEKYGLLRYLSNDSKVLDIGCNCGFMDMMLASKCNHITGLEYDGTMVEFSKKAAKMLEITNVDFVSADFTKWYPKNKEKYDVILSFAVHIWIGMEPYQYAKVCYDMLNPGGVLLFESQDISGDVKYKDFCDEFQRCGLEMLDRGQITDDGVISREFAIFRRRC